MGVSGQQVFVVDDEASVLKAIEETLVTLGVEVTYFVNPVKCLERLLAQKCDLLIADLKMPEMDGIELLMNVKRRIPWVPVLVVTGYGDIPTAVRAIKAGAVDFIEKPLEKGTLLSTVELILQNNGPANTVVGRPLTPTQTKVLELVIEGNSNREIADLLSRSVRTIEVHRAHVMEKLGVKNLLELIKRAIALGLVDLSVDQETEQS
ncbi:MAG: response regulator transcription factor [Phycisphaerales bacterium]|nr:MAG: response regulator transcription factor [Phycisphaerales bacterium]